MKWPHINNNSISGSTTVVLYNRNSIKSLLRFANFSKISMVTDTLNWAFLRKLNPKKGIPVLEDEAEGPLTPVESVIIRSPSPTSSSRLDLYLNFTYIKFLYLGIFSVKSVSTLLKMKKTIKVVWDENSIRKLIQGQKGELVHLNLTSMICGKT